VGETLVVTGVTGAYGGAVMLAIAVGAGRVVAAGRNAVALEAVARAGGARVVQVVLTDDIQADASNLRRWCTNDIRHDGRGSRSQCDTCSTS
jgi:alcohol dehydrogenase